MTTNHEPTAQKEYSETASRILDVAERMARQGGYNAFSFRDIANEIGIKSASIHYHFPTKETLAAALVERYTDRFLRALGQPDDAEPDQMLHRYIDACRSAIVAQDLMCLCGMFGAEIARLPLPVADRTGVFFDRNIAWLRAVFEKAGAADPHARAAQTLAALEGAMILARTLGNVDLFDTVAAGVTREFR